MTVRAILSGKGGDVTTLSPAQSVTDAISLLDGARIGAAPVVDRGRVLGVFSERDVMHCLHRLGADALDKPVEDVMTAPAVTVDPNTPVLAALSLMTRRRIRHLPVVEDERLVGIVSIGDLVKHRIDRIENEAAMMRDYITSA